MTPVLTIERSVEKLALAARDITAERNDAIIEMRRAGYSLREIAAYAQMSHSAIAKIVKDVEVIEID